MHKLNKKWSLVLAGLMVAILAACSNKDDTSSAMLNSGGADQATTMSEVAHQIKLPQPDKSVGLDQYEPITSGEMLMFSFYGLSKMPIDMNELASRLSVDYRRTQDQFKKQDILAVLEPRIKEKLAAHSQNRYFTWEFNDYASSLIEHYDFQRKVFPIKSAYWNGEYRYYWNDIMDYTIGFKAPVSLKDFKVEDEETARKIEQLLSEGGRNATLIVYCYAQDFDLNEKKINTLVTTFELRDSKGKVLARQTM